MKRDNCVFTNHVYKCKYVTIILFQCLPYCSYTNFQRKYIYYPLFMQNIVNCGYIYYGNMEEIRFLLDIK